MNPFLPSTIERNKIIKFGDFNWVVLDVQDQWVLLLSHLVLGSRPYYHSIFSTTTWEFSSLRKYLNREFLITYFSQEEKAMIETVQLKNYANPWYTSPNGNDSDTEDNIFLLSLEEVVQYFGDSGKLFSHRKKENEICDEFNHARAACDDYGSAASWALRTPGIRHNKITCVNGGVSYGHINVSGRHIRERFGVRPALWLDLSQHPHY